MYGVEYAPRIFIFRADARPAGAGPGTHPKKQAAARSRRRPERARSARALAADAARKSWTRRRPRPRRSPGLAGRAGPSWPPRGRPRPMPTPARRDRTAAGPVSAVDARTVVGAARRAAGAAERRGAAAAARGLQRRGPARPSRGRAWAAVTRRVACVRSARSAHGPKTLALRARGARARGKKRRAGVLGRRRRPRRENCVRKGGAVPFWGRSASSGLVISILSRWCDDKRNRLITKEE